MTTAELRIPRDVQDVLYAYITQAEEWAGYLLCGTLATADGVVLLGREWCPVPARYRIGGTRHGMTWHPNFDVEMLNRAQVERLSCVVIHHHGGPSPRLSPTDQETCESLMPFLSREAPAQPHAFVVMGNRAAAGRVYRGGQHFADLSSTRIVGSAFEVWPPISEDLEQALDIDPRHDRLVRGFGPKALTRLRAAKIGVAGSGGGGSHVLQQLAYLGVATLVPADGDRVELTNLNRLIGSAPQRKRRNFVDRLLRRGRGDVGRAKVAVMEELVHAINENAVVDAHFEHFPSAETVQAFKECDLIVACVDRLQVRDDLNRLCKRYLIPLIDVGLEIVPGEGTATTVAAIPGRVTKVQPDGPCLRCQGIVDDAKLERERSGRPPGYAGDQRLPDPAVVTLNGIVASIATTEVLQVLTGFAGSNSPNCGWLYDGLTGAVERVEKTFRGCPTCIPERGAGDT